MARKSKAERLGEKGINELEVLIRAIAAEHVRAQARLEALSMESLLSGRLGVRRYRDRQRRTAQTYIRKLEKAIGRPVSKVVKDAFRLGTRVADTGLPGREEVRGQSRINQEAVDLLEDNLNGRLGDARITVGRRIDDVFRREGIRLAAGQLTDEQTLDKASQRLVRRLTDEGITAFEDRTGRKWKLETYAEMVTRTTTSEALFQGTQTRMLARGFDLVVVNSVLDPCPICEEYDGNTYSLTGRSNVYPRLKITFPIHPNCRHFIGPSSEAAAERRRHRDSA